MRLMDVNPTYGELPPLAAPSPGGWRPVMSLTPRCPALFHADGSSAGPVGPADSLEHHIEHAHRGFAFDDAVAHFVKRSVLDRSGVADNGVGSPRGLPDVTVGSGLEREVSRVSLRVRVH